MMQCPVDAVELWNRIKPALSPDEYPAAQSIPEQPMIHIQKCYHIPRVTIVKPKDVLTASCLRPQLKPRLTQSEIAEATTTTTSPIRRESLSKKRQLASMTRKVGALWIKNSPLQPRNPYRNRAHYSGSSSSTVSTKTTQHMIDTAEQEKPIKQKENVHDDRLTANDSDSPRNVVRFLKLILFGQFRPYYTLFMGKENLC